MEGLTRNSGIWLLINMGPRHTENGIRSFQQSERSPKIEQNFQAGKQNTETPAYWTCFVLGATRIVLKPRVWILKLSAAMIRSRCPRFDMSTSIIESFDGLQSCLGLPDIGALN
jgi:hypothetical protein